LAEACFVRKEICNVFGLLTDIRALVLPIFINVLEFFERFDDVDIGSKIDNDVF